MHLIMVGQTTSLAVSPREPYGSKRNAARRPTFGDINYLLMRRKPPRLRVETIIKLEVVVLVKY
jgi:hypothetical protein